MKQTLLWMGLGALLVLGVQAAIADRAEQQQLAVACQHGNDDACNAIDYNDYVRERNSEGGGGGM